MLGLFGGREAAPMIRELTGWFEFTYGKQYGGTSCRDITNDDPYNRITLCPALIEATYEQAKAILIENGYDLYDLNHSHT